MARLLRSIIIIDTGNSKPIKQRMRRTPLGYANEEQEHLESF